MFVTLDGRRITREFTPGCTLQMLLDELRTELPGSRLIVSVAVDGQLCDEDELEKALPRPLEPDAQIDLESADRCAVAVAALRSVARELGDIRPRLAQLTEELQAGQIVEAVRQVGQLVQVWQRCRDVLLQSGSLRGCDLTELIFSDRPLREHLLELAAKLRGIRDALDARDMVLLADLLHYEMPPLCQLWHDLLLAVADQIAEN